MQNNMTEKIATGTERDPEHWKLEAILRKGRRVMEEIRAETEEGEEGDNE